MRVAVIGAGPAGMTAAYQLAKGGVDVEVFEAGESVGGMARTIELWGQKVDLGPHRFFSNDPRVNRLWLEVVGRDYAMVDRLTRIYYRRRFFYYPLQPRNALWNLGIGRSACAMLSYLKEKALPYRSPNGRETFESWVVRRFGRRLFEIFFKSYSEKLWGVSCRELDADFAAQRIKKFSLGEAIRSALGLSRQQHKTLVDRFAYPLGGSGMVYERMAERVRSRGGKVHLGLPVLRVVQQGRRVSGVELADGRREAFDHVVSTMPLTLLISGMDDVPEHVRSACDALGYRNTILVYLHVAADDLFADQWLYLHSPELLAGRMTNFRNWVPQLYGDAQTTILALEYWCYDHDPLWAESDGQLVDRGRREALSTGLLGTGESTAVALGKGTVPFSSDENWDSPPRIPSPVLGRAEVLDGRVIRIRRSYPVYRAGYKDHLAQVMAFLGRIQGVTPIGRYGAFKYNNQDHSILMGILAAENLLDARGHDLAAVNADYEDYQESASITATGLAQAR